MPIKLHGENLALKMLKMTLRTQFGQKYCRYNQLTSGDFCSLTTEERLVSIVPSCGLEMLAWGGVSQAMGGGLGGLDDTKG